MVDVASDDVLLVKIVDVLDVEQGVDRGFPQTAFPNSPRTHISAFFASFHWRGLGQGTADTAGLLILFNS